MSRTPPNHHVLGYGIANNRGAIGEVGIVLAGLGVMAETNLGLDTLHAVYQPFNLLLKTFVGHNVHLSDCGLPSAYISSRANKMASEPATMAIEEIT